MPAGNPVVTGTTISSTVHNNTMNDIASELTNSTDKDGQTVITGNWDFNGNKIVLDVDGDSSITVDTDDQLDIELGGSDVLVLTIAAGIATDNLTGEFGTFNSSAASPRLNLNSTNASAQPGIDFEDSGTKRAGIKIDSSENFVLDMESLANALLVSPAGVFTFGAKTVLPLINLGAATELTIDSGAVTATQTRHRIDTESDAASDDLDTINGGSDGNLIMLRAENDARSVVVKHGTGNIYLNSQSDFTLSAQRDTIVLMYDGTTSSWNEWTNSDNAT